MAKFFKSGKVLLVLQGKYAGKKAVIVKQHDEGTKERPFPHVIVAGVDRSPLKVTKSMNKRKVARRSRIKPFIKAINYNHIMPTRYSIDIDLKQIVTSESIKDVGTRKATRNKVKKLFEERYNTGKNRWFFQKLRI